MLKKKSSVRAQILRNALGGAGIGLGGSLVENATLLDDSDPKIKAINSVLGTLTGGVSGGMFGKYRATDDIKALLGAGGVAAGWPLKQMGLLGVDRFDKFTDQQIPTALLNRETAQLQLDKTKGISAQDIGALAMGLGALSGAGGLGYYLWNKHGPGRRRNSRVRVTLPTKDPNDVETEIDAELADLKLSKRTQDRLFRDAERRLRDGGKERTQRKPKSKAAPKKAEPEKEPEDPSVLQEWLSKFSASASPAKRQLIEALK